MIITQQNLIPNDQNISGKNFRFDSSLLQVMVVCDQIYILCVVVTTVTLDNAG
jgi:hypothetical protein